MINIYSSLYDIAESCKRRVEQVAYNPQNHHDDFNTLEGVIESLQNLMNACIEADRT